MRDLERRVQKVQRMKRNAHDRLIQIYLERLTESDIPYKIKHHYEYGRNGRKCIICGKMGCRINGHHKGIGRINGEIDLLATYGDRVLIFEMKGADSQRNYIKAVKQLNKAKQNFKNLRVFTFYVAPRTLEWIH